MLLKSLIHEMPPSPHECAMPPRLLPQVGPGTNLWLHSCEWCHSPRRRQRGPGRSDIPPGPGGWCTPAPAQVPSASRLHLQREDSRREATWLALLTTERDQSGGVGPRPLHAPLHTLQPLGLRPKAWATFPKHMAPTCCSSGVRGRQGLHGGSPAPHLPSHPDLGHIRPG